MESKAEEKKNLGNDEFKKGNYQKAVKFYTEALSKNAYSNALKTCMRMRQSTPTELPLTFR